MSVMQAFAGGESGPPSIPADVHHKLNRGREWVRKDAAKRRLCVRFEKGDTYFFLDGKGHLTFQSTSLNPVGGGVPKPGHRIRNQYNFIRPIVTAKVSRATQRIPGYEVMPSTTDPRDVDAARLSGKIALYGYGQWDVRDKMTRAIYYAIGGGGDGFLMPYFDPNVGPYTPRIDPETGLPAGAVGRGEIKIKVLSGNEVSWEPGVDFKDSRWWIIEQARPIADVMEMPGFFGKKLAPDAAASDLKTDAPDNNKLVLVTEFYERPSLKYPEGRRIVIANNRVIVDYRLINQDALSPFEPYPLTTGNGEPVDEPILHRIAWNPDLSGDRDLGLTWQLIDAQRTIQDCWNKLLEWKNRVLVPRVLAPNGSNLLPVGDEPGSTHWYDPGPNGEKPEFEQVPTSFAQPLFSMLEKMQGDMREMGFDSDIQASANVAARTVNAVMEQDQAKTSAFMAHVAEIHSSVMRHCLQLVATHYSERRKIAIRGDFGPETIDSFTGADLYGQIDVRVSAGSLEYLTRDQNTQRVFAYAERGWITPQQAMLAIDSGSSEALTQSVELDVAKIDRIIQRIKDGTVMEMPTRPEIRTDEMTGEPIMEDVPVYMPQDGVDDLDVWRRRLSDWMKTPDYESCSPEQQEQATMILQGIDHLMAVKQQREIAAQNAQAEQLGMKNAAKPQGAKPLPSQKRPEQNDPEAKSPTGLPKL